MRVLGWPVCVLRTGRRWRDKRLACPVSVYCFCLGQPRRL